MALSQITSSTPSSLYVLTLAASLAYLLCTASALVHGSTQLPASIKYYVHALNTGAVTIVQPNNTNTMDTFGQAAVFAYTVHKGADLSSKKLGTIRGLEIYNSMDASDSTILILNTLVYVDGVYNGTISIHGQANMNDNEYELTVVGGTGSFRAVAGYAAITNLKTPGDDHVFEHNVYFLSPPTTTCPAITVS